QEAAGGGDSPEAPYRQGNRKDGSQGRVVSAAAIRRRCLASLKSRKSLGPSPGERTNIASRKTSIPKEEIMIELDRQAAQASSPRLAASLADPRLTAAAAAQLETVSITTKGGKKTSAALARPGRKAPAVLLIHEWWGLNDQIKSVAAELSEQGYLALACDLYKGVVTSDAGKAGALMEAVN